jgi:hypothetical protein
MPRKQNIATLLKADLTTNMPLKMMAGLLRGHGRGRDTMLAHITPREAAKLKKEGGRGSTNPHTGLPEFDDTFSFDPGGFQNFAAPAGTTGDFGAGASPQAETAPLTFDQRAAPVESAITSGDFYAGGGGYTPQFSPVAGDATLPANATPPSYTPPYNPPFTVASPVATPQTAGASVTPATLDELAYGQGIPPISLAPPTGETPTGGLFGKGGLLQGISPLQGILGAAGLGFGLYNQAQARRQAQALQDQYNAAAAQQLAQAQAQATMAQPFLTQGALQTGLAAQGALTATNQQAFDAARAQIAQRAAGQGGAVAASQVAANEERMRQQSLSTQMQQGLALFGTGTSEYNTSVAQLNNALSTELQGLNANVNISLMANVAASNFYTNLARFMVPTAKA